MRPIIRVENLSKQYRIGGQQLPYVTLRESLVDTVRAPLRWLRGQRAPAPTTLWALKDVGFEVRPGEVLGLIGRNGAGKSTLLKILSRITAPTTGRADLYGRVGSLLEVGAGFHAELSGRENVFLSGAVLGMRTHEIHRKLDQIVDFADLAKFIDTPVKHYSSGMYMRLAFAVAAHLETEILLVDEVLAVGDSDFQKKCLGKMGEVAHQGRTVLFVSHQMSAVKTLCSRALLFHRGTIQRDGDAHSVVDHYMKTGHADLSPERVWQDPLERPGNSMLRLCGLRVLHPSGELRSTYPSSEAIVVELDFELTRVDRRLCVGFNLVKQNGAVVFQSSHTDGRESSWPVLQLGRNRLRCTIPPGLLNYGSYWVAPLAYLHSLEWVLQSDPEVTFDILLDHGVSPYWSKVEQQYFPGVIAPCLQWERAKAGAAGGPEEAVLWSSAASEDTARR